MDTSPPKRRERGERGDRPEREPREKRHKTERKGFDDAVWVELNVGRKKNAEARWILPVLCKAGGLSRDDIGAIRINPGDTHVELTRDGAERFFAALGDGGTLEKGLRASPLDGPPSAPARFDREDRSDRPAPRLRKKPYDPDAPRKFSGKKPYEKKAARDDAPAAAERAPSPQTDYIQDDREKPAKPAKSFSKVHAKDGWKPPMRGKGKPARPAGKGPGKGPAKGGKPAFQKGGKPLKKHRKPPPKV